MLAGGASLAGLGLAGCGSPGATEQGSTKSSSVRKLVFLTNADDTQARTRVKDWNAGQAKKAGFTVELRQTDSSTYAANFPRIATSSDAPGIAGYFIDGGLYADLANAGRLLDLTAFWKSSGLEQHVPSLIRDQYYGLTGGDKVFGAPTNTSRYGILFSRTSTLTKAGVAPPENHEWASEQAFTAACDKLKAAGIAPMSVGGKDGYPISHLQDGLLSSTMPPEQILKPKEIDYGSAAWKAPIEKLLEWSRKDYFAKGYLGRSTDQATTIFAKSQAGFTTGMNVWVPLMTAAGVPRAARDWCLLPAIGSLKTKVSVYAGGGLVIPAAAAGHKQALAFADWLVSPDVALASAKEGEVIPARTDVPGLRQALGRIGGSMQEFAAQPGRSQFGWDDPAPTAMIEYDRKNLQAVLTGSQSVVKFSQELDKLKRS